MSSLFWNSKTDALPRLSGALQLLVSCLLLLALAASGCRDEKVVSYRIPKETELPAEISSAAPSASAPAAASPIEVAAGPGLTWTAPATWTAKPLGAMRKGSFTVTGPDGASADLSITAFPGAVGGELANLNRWRGQLSLAPVSEAELTTATTRLATDGGLSLTVVELTATGPAPQAILGAMVPYGQAMWFFKLSGPASLLTAEKPAFLAFLKTIRAAAPATP
jgi:hypothetical protein